MNGNLIDFYRYQDQQELDAFVNLFKIAKLVEVVKVTDDGDIDMKDIGIEYAGFVFGDDFVTFEKNYKVFPINLSLDNPDYCDEYYPGIYVSKLTGIDEYSQYHHYHDALVNDLSANMALARKIEKWYFEDFLPNNRNYYTDSKSLIDKDDVYFGDENVNTGILHQFSNYSKKK